jgi:hypothetical protein
VVKKPAVIVFLHARVEGSPGLEGGFCIFLGSEDHVFQEGKGDGADKERVREDSDIGIVILALVIVQSMGEEIRFVVFTWLVNKFVMIFG